MIDLTTQKFGKCAPDIHVSFEPFIRDAVANGFDPWLYASEFWFEFSGIKRLEKILDIATLVDAEAGATKKEKKLAELVKKHYPQLKPVKH